MQYEGGLDLHLSFYRVGGLDMHFAPLGQNRSSHQCLHWWQQVSTGHLQLNGFKSPRPNKKDIRMDVLFIWCARGDLNPHARNEH